MSDLMKRKELIVPLYDSEITSKSDINSRWDTLPLLVIWSIRSAGDNLDMTVTLNHLRLEHELESIAPNLKRENMWDQNLHDAGEALRCYAQSFLSSIVNRGYPVPLGLEKGPRSELLQSLNAQS